MSMRPMESMDLVSWYVLKKACLMVLLTNNLSEKIASALTLPLCLFWTVVRRSWWIYSILNFTSLTFLYYLQEFYIKMVSYPKCWMKCWIKVYIVCTCHPTCFIQHAFFLSSIHSFIRCQTKDGDGHAFASDTIRACILWWWKATPR